MPNYTMATYVNSTPYTPEYSPSSVSGHLRPEWVNKALQNNKKVDEAANTSQGLFTGRRYSTDSASSYSLLNTTTQNTPLPPSNPANSHKGYRSPDCIGRYGDQTSLEARAGTTMSMPERATSWKKLGGSVVGCVDDTTHSMLITSSAKLGEWKATGSAKLGELKEKIKELGIPKETTLWAGGVIGGFTQGRADFKLYKNWSSKLIYGGRQKPLDINTDEDRLYKNIGIRKAAMIEHNSKYFETEEEGEINSSWGRIIHWGCCINGFVEGFKFGKETGRKEAEAGYQQEDGILKGGWNAITNAYRACEANRFLKPATSEYLINETENNMNETEHNMNET